MVGLPVIIILLWLAASLITTVLFIFVTASIISLMLNPLVRRLEWMKIPRYLGVFIVYLALLAVIVVFFVVIIPPAIEQLTRLVDHFPQYANSIREQIDSWKSALDRLKLPFDVGVQASKLADSIQSALVNLGPVILAYSIDFVGGLTRFLIILVISIYMLLDAKRIGRFIRSLFPADGQADAEEFVRRTQQAVTHWVQAQILLSFLIGLSVGIGIWFLGLIGIWPEGTQYAVFFGAWAGVTEFIPYLGPILGAVPPVVVALFSSPWAALAVVAVFIFIQEVEAHILVPNIMGQVIGVHPLVVIFAMLAGAEIAGLFGILLAVPIVALGREVVLFFRPRISLEKWKPAATPPAVDEATGKTD